MRRLRASLIRVSRASRSASALARAWASAARRCSTASNLGTRLFLSGSCRRLGSGIALGLSGKSRARFVQTAPCILGVGGKRLLALDVGGDLGESARNLFAIASELLLLLGQPFVLDAQPLQGGGPFGFVLAPLGQHRGSVRLPARGIRSMLRRLCHPAGGILRLARHLFDTGARRHPADEEQRCFRLADSLRETPVALGMARLALEIAQLRLQGADHVLKALQILSPPP